MKSIFNADDRNLLGESLHEMYEPLSPLKFLILCVTTDGHVVVTDLYDGNAGKPLSTTAVRAILISAATNMADDDDSIEIR